MRFESSFPWARLAALAPAVAGLALFILAAVLSHRALLDTIASTAQRAYARETLMRGEQVLSLLKDVEAGQRGYLLTGQPSYLQPYHHALARLPPALDDLERRLRQLPGAPATDLRGLIRQRLALAHEVLALHHQHGPAAAREALLQGHGKAKMDDLRRAFSQIERHLRARIEALDRQVRVLQRRALGGAILLGALGSALLIAAFALLWREQRRRVQAERARGAAALNEAMLRQHRDHLRAFALRLEADIEAERRRLAREVHDQLGQVFTALKLRLHAADAQSGAAPLAACDHLIEAGIGVARRIAADLRPPLLDDLGLGAALHHQAHQLAAPAGLNAEVTVADDPRLSPPQVNALFRIAQEALTNVLRHARASRVRITGEAGPGGYLLAVEDDGRGLAGSEGLGMLGMRERAELMGASLSFAPAALGGLRVAVLLPLPAARNLHHDTGGHTDAHPDG